MFDIVIIMKKRTYRKIKKLFPRAVLVAFALFLLVFSVYQSIDGFIKLHNGASYESIEGHRYSPVINETLVLMGVGVIFLGGVKLITKWNNLRIAGLGVVVYAAIGFFAYWALRYTHQSIPEGFITITVIVLAIVAFIALALMFEAYVRKKRKQTRGKQKHPAVKINDAIERRKEFICICGTGDKISLGLHWVKTVNIIWVTILIFVMLFALYDPTLRIIALIVALLFTGIVTFNYRYLYRNMIRHGHTPDCSKQCAEIGVWYQARGSSFHIYTPRPSRVKGAQSAKEQ